MVSKCPQCKGDFRSVKYDIGYGIIVNSLHCRKCGFNVTDNEELNKGLALLREHMRKEVKILRIGTGLGIRFPNDIVKSYCLKKGKDMMLKPEADGIKLVAAN
ncbi:MAG: hypothetical protein V1702_00035 [Candidatus Woesearchaeota archaeon]